MLICFVHFTILRKEMYFDDGDSPSTTILSKWLQIVDSVFPKKSMDGADAMEKNSAPCIAIHCLAGLGRAPCLVAVALMARCNLKALEAISLIRKKRSGAINNKQVNFLTKYKTKQAACAIM